MRLVVLFALAVLLAAPAALAGEAETEPETVELAYRVPEGCPDEDAFIAAVAARTRRAKFARHAARRFVIDIRRRADRSAARGYAGRLVVERGEDRAAREVTSARCDDVVEAFVFFTAIAIDPGASLSPAPAPVRDLEPEPPPSPAHRASVPERTIAAERPNEGRSAPAPEAKPPSWHLAAGSGGVVATGIADTAMVAVHPVIDLASDAAGVSPSVRLGLTWANSSSQPTAPFGRLTLGLRAVSISGCGYRLALGGESAAVRLCALVEAGLLAVRPFALEYPTAPDRPWLAVGPLVRLDVPILPKVLSLGCDAGLAIPFEREQVYVRSGPTVEVVQDVGLRIAAVVLLQAF